MFQNVSFFVVMLGIIACNPIIYGLHFLEREPRHFLCKKDAATWVQCTKVEVCYDYNGERSSYRAVQDVSKDADFVENWVMRMDMLCESRLKIGMLGFSYFLGVVIGLALAPPLADLCGKQYIFCSSLLLSLIGQASLLYITYSSLVAMFFLLVIGLSWAGKTIVGLSYILDFLP